MLTIPTTEAELINTITSLNSKHTCGLSNKIIKLCNQQISKPLIHIFNKSPSQGIFPDQLKYDTLSKKDDKTLVANYRPISLLTGFSKLLGALMFSVLCCTIYSSIYSCMLHVVVLY
jgi:hypothetical protein